MGLGPSGSNSGQIFGLGATPTFVETLFQNGVISEPTFGIAISPLGADGSTQSPGEITFGGVDPSKFSGTAFQWDWNKIIK